MLALTVGTHDSVGRWFEGISATMVAVPLLAVALQLLPLIGGTDHVVYAAP